MSNKLRSGLSSLGIIIGVSSVVILMSLGEGFKKQFAESMGEMASNSVTIRAGGGRDSSNIARKLPMNGDTIRFLETTFKELNQRITGRMHMYQIDKIIHGSKSSEPSVEGVTRNHFTISKSKFYFGTGFSEEDFDKSNNVAVVSYNVLEKLFESEDDPVGRTVTIKGKVFTIIGVLEKGMQDGFMRSPINVYVPYTTAIDKLGAPKMFDSLGVMLPTQADNEQRRQMIHYALLRYIGVNKVSDGAFSVDSYASFVKEIEAQINAFGMFLAIIGGISLLVGGIGVMNIMIVSVTERTREIGIRKAIGALKMDIIMQFLVESVVITFLGGVIAVLFSRGIIFGINYLIEQFGQGNQMLEGVQLTMTFNVVAMAFGLTTAIGIVFGILPARKAMKLKPIDALRFE